MSGTRADARKRVEQQAAFTEPQWAPTDACCELHGRVLTALRKVYGTSDMGEAVALADALEDEGVLS